MTTDPQVTDLQERVARLENALARLCGASNHSNCADHHERDSSGDVMWLTDNVEPGSPLAYYVLSSMCWDLRRRMEYFFEALLPVGNAVKPEKFTKEFARRVARDHESIQDSRRSGTTRAEKWRNESLAAERIVHDQSMHGTSGSGNEEELWELLRALKGP